jgi:hypothetical protein
MDKKSIDMLIEASTAEAEAVSAVWRAAKEASVAAKVYFDGMPIYKGRVWTCISQLSI